MYLLPVSILVAWVVTLFLLPPVVVSQTDHADLFLYHTANCAPPEIHVECRWNPGPGIQMKSCKEQATWEPSHMKSMWTLHMNTTWTSYGFHEIAAHMKSICYLYEPHVLFTWNSWNPLINVQVLQVVSLWNQDGHQYRSHMKMIWVPHYENHNGFSTNFIRYL